VLDRAARAVAAAALLIELVIILTDVTKRELFHSSFLWDDEASKMALSIVAFIGGAAAYRGGQHTSIRLVLEMMPVRVRAFLLAMLEWIVIVTG
jgi:TRAP-type C4-dicarboxylate transport system permease small subunit